MVEKFKIGDGVLFSKDNKIHTILSVNPWVTRQEKMEYVITNWGYLVWESELTQA